MKLQKIRSIVEVALLSALALVLSYLETMIPLPVAVPGIKLGLANLAVLIALYRFDWKCAGAVACVKVLAAGLLFGSPVMLIYSLLGMALAFACMLILHGITRIDVVLVSITSAICHNIGQLIAAALMLGTWSIFSLLPILAVAACATGMLIGLITQTVLDALEIQGSQRPYIDLTKLDIVPGKHIVFIGANGSGKTSAALQIAGLFDDEVNFDTESDERACTHRGLGHPGHTDRTGQTERISRCAAHSSEAVSSSDALIVFQNPDNQIINSHVGSDVAFGPENRGISRSEMLPLVRDSLTRVHAEDLEPRQVSELSGGQKQRVAIAGALACTPRVVVFDEATSMLDAAGYRRHQALIDELLSSGKTVISVMQHIEEALCADTVVLFADCMLIAVGTPEEICTDEDLMHQAGLELAPITRVVQQLRAHDIPLSGACDEKALGEELICLLAHT